jgi:uncharacterized protein YeeX (DUF496 family)
LNEYIIQNMAYDTVDRKNVIELEQKRYDSVLRLSCFRQLQLQKGDRDVRTALKSTDRTMAALGSWRENLLSDLGDEGSDDPFGVVGTVAT